MVVELYIRALETSCPSVMACLISYYQHCGRTLNVEPVPFHVHFDQMNYPKESLHESNALSELLDRCQKWRLGQAK